MDKLKIIASSKNWIDTRSIETLRDITQFDGVSRVVGLPDLSVGRVPNGMAVMTKNRIYPHLIGGDIGCGMNLVQSFCKGGKIKVDRFEKRLQKLQSLDDIEIEDKPLGYNLGSIGKGNHFAELHLVNEVKDKTLFEEYRLDEKALRLKVER